MMSGMIILGMLRVGEGGRRVGRGFWGEDDFDEKGIGKLGIWI
jgi:hypothetical protein